MGRNKPNKSKINYLCIKQTHSNMKKTLYYTVYYETYDGVEQNGVREITVYVIEDNIPKTFAQFEAFSTDGEKDFSDEEEIQTYLDNNGYDEDDYELTEL